MVQKFVGGALAVSVAAVLVLSGCSGNRLMPGASDAGPGTAGISVAPESGASPIVYKGPKVKNKPEVDLYSTTAKTPGSNASFKLSQSGNSSPFTYAFKAVPKFANNCPKTSKASFAVSPASGSQAKGGKYTVKATSKGAAGECAVTFTGASGATLKVLLTFTTSGVVVGKPPSI